MAKIKVNELTQQTPTLNDNGVTPHIITQDA